MSKYILSACLLFAISQPEPIAAAPVDCAAMISGHIAWMGAGLTNRRIGAKFARVKITSSTPAPSTTKWGHVSVSEGAFGWHQTDMSGRFFVAFSDRGFDPNRRDITDITLWRTGRAEVMLRSWGNTVLPLSDLHCDSAGFLTGMEHEGNGTSLVTLSFRRETY